MMIDTDRARKELEGVGFTPEQTEAQLNVARMIDEQYRDNLATKADLERVEQAMATKADLEKVELAMEKLATKEELKELKALMYRTALVTALTTIGIILAGMWGLLELYLG